MSQERLSVLVLIAIETSFLEELDVKSLIDDFASKHVNRMALFGWVIMREVSKNKDLFCFVFLNCNSYGYLFSVFELKTKIWMHFCRWFLLVKSWFGALFWMIAPGQGTDWAGPAGSAQCKYSTRMFDARVRYCSLFVFLFITWSVVAGMKQKTSIYCHYKSGDKYVDLLYILLFNKYFWWFATFSLNLDWVIILIIILL